MRAFSLLTFALCGAIGCSGASNGQNAGDSGADSMGSDAISDAPADTPVDAAPPHAACGSPPYVTYHLHAGEITKTGDTGPLSGASLTFDLCPELSVTTNGAGEAYASVQRGVPFTATVSATNHVSVIAGEELVPIDDPLDEDRFAQLLPADNAFVIPGYGSDAPSFALVIQPDGISGSPCDTTQNVKFTTPSGVTAHYMLPTWPSDMSEPLTDASIGAVVFFTGLTPGQTTAFPSTSGGKESVCDVTAGAPTHQTGKFKLVAGAWTVGNLVRFSKS